ncbi:MAG: 3-deoxy-D-manno-octulosonic acid transferase [Prolixibacteraceae bacterium]|nr:3-deoxy-D-manno-octulosonic acid transferase [Prolixibacteraceae bacterium]MBN2774417.1 3-deoxy-D-manno-octulosonic acid transferase [Prolixibacteraceae bacterium]
MVIRILYNASIFIYGFLIRLGSLFNEKAKLFVKGRKNWKKELIKKVGSGTEYIWFHCASLGEFEQGRPVIEKVRSGYPDYKILLTFFSPSGYEIRKNYEGADVICYLPLDTSWNVKSFYNIIHPKKVFFIKYEFWFNYLTEAKRRNIPVYIISAIFRPEQWFFKKNFIGRWYQQALSKIEHFFIQNEDSGKLLSETGYTNFTVSGDTRFDRVAEIALKAKQIPLIEKFKDNKPLIVVGSSWPPDEEILIRYINQSEGVKFIIAPHEVSATNVSRVISAVNKQVELFSNLNGSDPSVYDVIIIDSVGLLSSLYKYSEIAYIGGGFGVGIHNILEAATFGMPVLFGPNYKKFKEANDLVGLNVAFPIQSYEDLEQNLNGFLADSERLHRVSVLAKNYVEQNKGAAKIILNRTFEL